MLKAYQVTITFHFDSLKEFRNFEGYKMYNAYPMKNKTLMDSKQEVIRGFWAKVLNKYYVTIYR